MDTISGTTPPSQPLSLRSLRPSHSSWTWESSEKQAFKAVGASLQTGVVFRPSRLPLLREGAVAAVRREREGREESAVVRFGEKREGRRCFDDADGKAYSPLCAVDASAASQRRVARTAVNNVTKLSARIDFPPIFAFPSALTARRHLCSLLRHHLFPLNLSTSVAHSYAPLDTHRSSYSQHSFFS
jgi:hypothetical protein